MGIVASREEPKRMKRIASGIGAFATAALSLLSMRPLHAQQVYIGSANGWHQMIDHPNQWNYVRHNADGFYVNFIELLHADTPTMARLSPLFTHRNAYFESDSRYTGLGGFPDGGQFSLDLQTKEMSYLLEGGFQVPYTSLNYGFDLPKAAALRRQGLKDGASRPCFAQYGPWEFGGDLTTDFKANARIRTEIGLAEGATTDGPLSLWAADQGKMRAGSLSLVKYAHNLKKNAAVMVAPYDLKPRSLWLQIAQDCVRQHEDAGAKPDIWIVFEYATDTPTLPETNADGTPANTITGMAYWLIHHLHDPAHAATIEPASLPSTKERTFVVRNTSTTIDLCPALFARVEDAHHDWDVRFRLDGKDITSAVISREGLAFTGHLRLWPGDARRVVVTMTPRKQSYAAIPLPTISVGLRPNPTAQAGETAMVILAQPPQPTVVASR